MFEYRPFVDQFLDYCRYHKKLSDKTVRAYKIDLSQYALFPIRFQNKHCGITSSA